MRFNVLRGVSAGPLFLFVSIAFAADNTTFQAKPVAAYPHKQTSEKVTIAVDPCDTPEKAGIFKVNYKGYGFYPVRLVISNDSDQTLMLQGLKIEYITANKDKLQPATDADIYRRLVKPSKADTGKPGIRLPFPVGKKKEPLSKEVREEYESAQLLTVPVTPHSIHSGYLFFDMMDMSVEPGAHLYISGIKAGTQELFYFDIPMDKAPAEAAPSK